MEFEVVLKFFSSLCTNSHNDSRLIMKSSLKLKLNTAENANSLLINVSMYRTTTTTSNILINICV